MRRTLSNLMRIAPKRLMSKEASDNEEHSIGGARPKKNPQSGQGVGAGTTDRIR